MTKKLFIKLSMLLFVLAMSTNVAWADEETTIYLASLKAQKSPASTGDGQVRLTWLDMTGKPFVNPIGVGESGLNPTNPVPETGYAATAQMIGGTLIAIDGMETPVEIGGSGSQIYMTCMVYFHPEGQPANGSYLADWTFTDAAITRMNDPMGDGSEERPYSSPCFKVLPAKTNSSPYPVETPAAYTAFQAALAEVTTNPNNIYAVFNKYLLGNSVATSANVEAEENATANLTVTVEVDGDAASLDAADFATFSFTNNTNSEWSYDLSAALASKVVVSAQKTRITIPVTYTYKNTGYGVKNSTMTVSMAGASPSSLNIPLRVVALDPNRPAAIWFDGKTEKTSGSLSDMLAVNTSSYTNPILKINKPVATELTFSGKDFSLDLNGNTTQAITISSGNVTFAYSSFGGSATSLSVNGGKAILAGGTFGSLTIGTSGTVEQNGATISGAATNNGTLTTTDGTINEGLTSSKTLTLNGGTFKGETAVTVSGGTANINRGDINGTSIGLKVTGGTATVKKLAAITSDGSYSAQRTGGTLNVECGKFGKPLNGTVNFTSGFFKDQNYGVSTEGNKEMLISAGVEYNEGYRYFLGDVETAKANGVPVCRIGTVGYAKLEDAIAYANNNPGVANIVIFMTNDYTLPAGYYTLPANATIVVPMSDTQEKEINETAPRVVFNDQRTETPYTSILPTEFRRLTFANGVNMDVFGDIELTCSQYASNEAYTSQPCGPYGRLVMEEGSRMTLQNGSELRAWGFMTGKGETDARRGAVVREMFQLGDWKGAMTSVKITGMAPNIVGDDSGKKIFPVTQYFIQNIESPVKYHPGSLLSTSAAVSEGLLGMSVSMGASDIGIVGVSRSDTDRDAAIFLMDEKADADNTWVRKWYDVENDIQVYDINSAAHIGSLLLDMGDINLLTYGTVPVRLNSANFDLPLTCNFKIHLLSGSMDFQQNTSLLPGAEVEVDKEATVTVAQDPDDTEHTGALYVYDAEQWDKYAYCNAYGESTSTAYTKVVRYAPSWKGQPTVRAEQTKPKDAAINVRGKFETAKGFVYTSESGANIFSTNEDAGTFIFNQAASEAGTRTVWNVKGVGTYESRTFYPAKLKNGNDEYVNTSTALARAAYCYQNDEWSTMIKDGCFMKTLDGNTDTYTYYAKPAEYVALANGKTPNADHTYSDAAGAGRLFILMSNCQWWEVEKKDNLYHCVHPNNDTYYYWGYDDDAGDDGWVEKTYTITWRNWDGTIIKTADADGNPQESYVVTYGTQAEFLGTNPTRTENIDYTYNFTGWSPAPGKVTSDVTYTATFEAQPRMYTIIFRQEGGVEIERRFLTHNEIPVCENTPTKVGHTLVWSPAIAAVTGDAVYTATWHEDPPTEYEVTFFDYNGTTELQKGNVNVGDTPEYTEATPSGKPATSEYTYVFDHWSPALEAVSATSVKTYTAVYREVAIKYAVRFEDEDGNEIETNQYAYGEMPVCSATPTKANTAQYTYSFAWNPQIQTVQGAATYRAEFTPTTNKYSVTVKCSPSGAATITGGGIYNYDGDGEDENNILITVTPNEDYINPAWSDKYPIGDLEDGKYTRTLTTLTSDVDLVISFTYDDPNAITITWKSEDGSETLATVGQKAGTATTFTKSAPTKDATADKTFTFYGWSTKVGTEENEWDYGTIYKNGMTPVATANATYYAYFKESARTYDIVWMNEAGTVNIEIDYDQPYGSAIAYNSATPTKMATEQYTYTFDGWSTEIGGNVVTLPATVTDAATFYAHFNQESLTPTPEPESIELDMTDEVSIDTPTEYQNLTITSDGVEFSGQIINAGNLSINGHADFVLQKTMDRLHWYDVAVPWRVDATSGIFLDGSASSAVLGSDIDLYYYDGSVRAAQGKVDECWIAVKDQAEKVLEPGRAYLFILYKAGVDKVTFRMKDGESLLTTETSVQQYNQTTGDSEDAGWNGIANPALFKAYLNAGTSVAQTINAAGEAYVAIDAESYLVVGQPIYVQVSAPTTAVANHDSYNPAPVRRTSASVHPARYQLTITAEGANKHADRLFVQVDEEKEVNSYVIGKDLSKFSTGTKSAQMWIDRYDTKLCLNTVAPQGDATSFPMSVYAPKAGEYTIAIEREVWTDEYELYLTYNGEAIWNLSEGAYVANLNKGTDNKYGLRVSARAPQVTTGVDEAIVDAQGNTQKVLINNQVFIIRNGEVYTLTGMKVE